MPMTRTLLSSCRSKRAIKERGALMVIPSGMADSMNQSMLGVAANNFRVEETKA